MERGLGLFRSCDDHVVLERFSICTSEQDSRKERGCLIASRGSLHGCRCHPLKETAGIDVPPPKRFRCNALAKVKEQLLSQVVLLSEKAGEHPRSQLQC